MPLQSQLFSGDAALEACLVSDPAHVTVGAAGGHVSKIQAALRLIDNARIESTELSTARYGASTGAAVLAFKRRRAIINRSYQTQADNIVGKMTIAELDREIARKENGDDDDNVGRIHCRSFPFPTEPPALPTVRSVAGTANSVTAPRPRPRPRRGLFLPSAQALRRVPDATRQVAAALEFIRLRRAQILTGLPDSQFSATEPFIALNTHFKLDKHPTPGPHLAFLERVYTRINMVLARADEIFIDDLRTGDFANAVPGGFNEPFNPQRGKIRFGPAYADKGGLFQTSVIIHEGAHFVDRTIRHFASELPPLAGTPVDSAKNYVQLNATEAAGNAYTYAQFALHASKGFDKRIVPFNE
jgi:hypothetical protein